MQRRRCRRRRAVPAVGRRRCRRRPSPAVAAARCAHLWPPRRLQLRVRAWLAVPQRLCRGASVGDLLGEPWATVRKGRSGWASSEQAMSVAANAIKAASPCLHERGFCSSFVRLVPIAPPPRHSGWIRSGPASWHWALGGGVCRGRRPDGRRLQTCRGCKQDDFLVSGPARPCRRCLCVTQ